MKLNDLEAEVSAGLREGIAERKAELLSHVTRTLDFGVAGEVECDIAFDYTPPERGAWDKPEVYAFVKVVSIKANGVELVKLSGDMVRELEKELAEPCEGHREEA